MKITNLLAFLCCFATLFSQNESQQSTGNVQRRLRFDFAQYVNPFVGTGGHGHTYPGASAPFGMMQLSPDTRYNGWDGCSGYHYSDSVIYGFSHTHLSGTGVEDLCDLLIVPQQGKYSTEPGYKNPKGYGSPFKHSDEKAGPGYYSVKLLKNDIDVYLTASERAGVHSYVFHQPKGKKYILIDLEHRDQLLGVQLNLNSKTSISGYRISKAWAKKQYFYFYMELNTPYVKAKMVGKNKVVLEFPEETLNLRIKVGISGVDIDGAKKNVESEIPFFDYDLVKTQTLDKWNQELNKIHFESPDKTVMQNFYTSVYHTYLCPNLFSDVDGRFRGNDEKIYQEKYNRYSVFSIWDTYRAAHPLYTLTQQKRSSDFIESFLGIYKETNELPVWELLGNETDCMIGYHATSIILDAYVKGIRSFDAKTALDAMIASASKNELGKNHFREYEFISSNQEPESVSKTLEYAYDDWTIADFARILNEQELYSEYQKRSYQFLNLFNPETKFMQPRRGGTWLSGFNPSEVNFNFTEANSWQYSLAAPQHIDALRYVLGGKAGFQSWLDQLFSTNSKLDGRQQADITGLIGQYAHGNEPSHHMAYLYNYTNEVSKTQEKVDQILREMYQPTPDGLCGNEDCGQMSAWYVLSAVGLYPVCPGKTTYAFGRPLQDYANFHFENGNSFYIRTVNNSPENKYIQSMTLNDRPYKKLFIEHDSLTQGGELVFIMGNKPNPELNSYESDLDDSNPIPDFVLPVPYFTATNESFTDSISTEIKVLPFPKLQIRYTTDGSEPNLTSPIYERKLTFSKTTTLKAKTFYVSGDNSVDDSRGKVALTYRTNDSKAVSTTFQKIDKNTSLKLNSAYANQYAAGGTSALIDGLSGSTDFRSGAWQGYEGIDASGELSFAGGKKIEEVKITCLQDNKSWIFMPVSITLWYSIDGVKYKKIKAKKFKTDPYQEGTIIDSLVFKLPKDLNIKHLRFTIKNRGICPKGHLGEGEKAWIFIDEIHLKNTQYTEIFQ